MSKQALRPVSELTAEARRINDRNLDIRLPVCQAVDEISDLSHTLNQMLERIDSAFASVRTFTGNASHELRTPIALLRTEIEVGLFRPRSGEEYRAILGRLHEETVRMSSLVENLLSVARADGGAELITVTPLRIADLFEEIQAAWNGVMQKRMLDFRVETPGGELALLGDAQAVPRLLSILLDNACKYTPLGGTVRLTAVPEGERVIVSVEDTGIGIASDQQARIFDRFYRVALADQPGPAGSGLGLALAKWIAERHGAEMKVESDSGRGSCFSISLPRASCAGADQSWLGASSRAAISAAGILASRNA
jgi:signal transduction histidine kinase